MAAALEGVLNKLLSDSTNEGQAEGFKEIQALFKDPNILRELCVCISQSANPGVRRYAALLARRRILKAKHWKKIPPDVKLGLKNLVLEAYIKDTEKTVRNALAELIGAIAKHDLSDGKWPELMNIINQSIRSNNVIDKEIALYTLSVIAKALGSKLKPHSKGLLSIFQKTLTDTSSVDIPYYTIRSLIHMVCTIGSEELSLFQSLIPNVIAIIKLLANTDQDKACKCLEIFDELVESEVSVLAPHLKSLVDFGLELASSEKYEDELRIKAVNMISYLIRMKKKAVMKQRLVQPILEVFFPLMCSPCPGDNDDDDVDDDEIELSLSSAAGQALDIMALHLPPAKLLPLLMHILPPAFESPDPYRRKAAYLALSVIAEGCSEFIRHKYLPTFIPVIIRGVKDTEAIVRNAALYAVGQYAEYLQPEISKYAPELLPVLFEYLHQVCLMLQAGHKDPPSLSRTFYALERFCENLEDIASYLPTLMDCLITFLTITTEKTLVKEFAVDSIGSVAAAAKENFVPYFGRVMDHLQLFISSPQTEATRPLQVQSIDTLAIIARTVGAETFMPLAHECVKCGLHLMQENDDPDIRRACYGLLSSIAVVLKTDMVPYLNVIAERLLESVKSTEGVSVCTNGVDTNTAFTLFEDGDENDNEYGNMNSGAQIENLEETEADDEDDDITGYSVENAYVEEKEGACLALRDLCEEVGVHFLPYMEVSFKEVTKLVDHLSDDVRKAAIGTLAQFCITLNNIFLETHNIECQMAMKTNLEILIPKLFTLVREDTEHVVVLGCLEALQCLIDKMKENVTHGSYLDPICMLIRDVFLNKLACQDADTNEDDEEDQEAEYDNLLLEYAGELIASLTKTVPWQNFAPYLDGLMPFLVAKSKKACTVSEKSFSIGTLADIISAMEAGSVKPFLPHLQPVFLSGMKEDNEEVRSNSVYGLGVLVENAGVLIFDQYPLYLQALSNMISAEDDPRTKDNICGAVARLIKTNCKDVPLNTVFPVFLQYLPLKEDQEENMTVYECLSFLQGIRCEQFFQNIPHILKICSEAVASGKLQDDTMVVVSKLLNNIYSEFPNMFGALLPMAVQQAMSAFDLRKTEIINSEKTKMLGETQMLNGILASLNLAAALEDSSGNSLPPSLREKAQAIQEKGGIDTLQSLLCELPSLLQRNKEILDECDKMLKDEEESDNELRSKFKTAWARTTSAKLNDPLKTQLSKYFQMISTAMSADGIVKEKFDKHKDKIALLCLPEDQLTCNIPAGSPVASCSSVERLKSLMREVDAVKADREALTGELESAAVDMRAKFLSALSSDGGVNEHALSVETLGEIYGPIQKRIQDNISHQERVVRDIQAANGEFSKEKNNSGSANRREALLCDLAAAHDAYMELLGNLEEGSKFYNNLTNVLVTFQTKINDFCFARKTEKEELCKDMQKDIVTQANQPSPLAPPHHNVNPVPKPARPPPPKTNDPATAPPPHNWGYPPQGVSTASQMPGQQQQQQPQHPQPPPQQPYTPYPAYQYPYPPVPNAYNPYGQIVMPPFPPAPGYQGQAPQQPSYPYPQNNPYPYPQQQYRPW